VRRLHRYLLPCALLAVMLLATPSSAAQPRPPARSATVPTAPVYGFPTSSYRYGWFGTKYWPRTSDHRGFYGEHYHFAYRCGY
jgi:hypothetical protein